MVFTPIDLLWLFCDVDWHVSLEAGCVILQRSSHWKSLLPGYCTCVSRKARPTQWWRLLITKQPVLAPGPVKQTHTPKYKLSQKTMRLYWKMVFEQLNSLSIVGLSSGVLRGVVLRCATTCCFGEELCNTWNNVQVQLTCVRLESSGANRPQLIPMRIGLRLLGVANILRVSWLYRKLYRVHICYNPWASQLLWSGNTNISTIRWSLCGVSRWSESAWCNCTLRCTSTMGANASTFHKTIQDIKKVRIHSQLFNLHLKQTVM